MDEAAGSVSPARGRGRRVRGDAKHRPARRVRALSSGGLSRCGDTLSPALSRKRERGLTSRLVGVQAEFTYAA